MSFDVTRWPLPDDIDRYQRDLKVPRDAIVRDIARLVTVAQMVHGNDLNDDLVLTGGMAMRLRGSPRFTMSDTDTSRRIPQAPDRDRLAEALTVDQSELTVSPGDVLGWKPGKKLVIARPVDYQAYFAGIGGAAVEGEFTFTVSWRGLIEPAQPLLRSAIPANGRDSTQTRTVLDHLGRRHRHARATSLMKHVWVDDPMGREFTAEQVIDDCDERER